MPYQKELNTAIDLISISVRTAPKSGGVDDIVFLAVNNAQKNKIAQQMIYIGKEKSKSQSDKTVRRAIVSSWATDAQAVQNSQGLVLVAVNGKKPFGANCGGCGFKACIEFQAHNTRNKKSPIQGPYCIFKIWDLGIAIASAAKTASIFNIDNRIMYRIGTAVQRLKIFKVGPVLGLPLSVSGKNIFFDRLDKLEAAKILMDYFKAKK
jgi:uncharacterized ferredoxin-like protein